MSKITDRIEQLARPVAEQAGCQLWDVEYVREAGAQYLRVTIDKEGGVGIDDCERVSRALDPILDEADPIAESYIFEVGSAGCERALKRPSDFERFMINDKGERVEEAGPSVPVEISGMSEVPAAGDTFNVVADERMARELVEQRKTQQKDASAGAPAKKVSLEDLFSQIQAGEMKTLNIIVKADVQGSAEAVKSSLEKISNDEVQVKVIHSGWAR